MCYDERVMKKALLILTLLFFTLSSSASAAMLGCWQKSAQKSVETPCHPVKDVKKKALDCCNDMVTCKTPVVYGPDVVAIGMVKLEPTQSVFAASWVGFVGTGPPTPPPKYSH